jgi:anti-anti-sigma factor
LIGDIRGDIIKRLSAVVLAPVLPGEKQDRVRPSLDFHCPRSSSGIFILMASPRRLQVNESASISVVRFKDQKIIDPVAIQELGQELFDLIEKDDRKKIVLNFDNVEFLSSAALGKLITFEKKAKRTGAQMILTNISPEIYQVFAITNLDKLFKIKDSEADALAVL